MLLVKRQALHPDLCAGKAALRAKLPHGHGLLRTTDGERLRGDPPMQLQPRAVGRLQPATLSLQPQPLATHGSWRLHPRASCACDLAATSVALTVAQATRVTARGHDGVTQAG